MNLRTHLEEDNDLVWVEDLSIEKVSICKEGHDAMDAGSDNDFVAEERCEAIASIPMAEGVSM